MVDMMREAIEHDRKELNLPHNPQSWSASDASRWVQWVCRKYKVPDISKRLDTFNGACLCSWSSDTFMSISNTSGLSVFQELELWKTANFYNTQTGHDDLMTSTLPFPILDSTQTQAFAYTPSSSPALSHVSSNYSNVDSQHNLFNSSLDNSEDDVFYSEREHTPLKPLQSSTNDDNNSSSSADNLKSVNLQKFKPRLGRGHKKAITLWQFLLELLIGEKDNSDCIKWLNKDSRIFKIEDSKKVASLWGKVKSRPAMNYDKLSRSVRQYYRKGIIKKPEQTKRLVYQFCPGIC